jgi:hypothetical protein
MEMAEAAVACALMLTGLPDAPVMPDSALRPPTPIERARSTRPRDAAGVYIPPNARYPRGLLVGGSFYLQVHEACHHLQYWAGKPFSEWPCERAAVQSYRCEKP